VTGKWFPSGRVRFVKPDAGYPSDSELAKRWLKVDHVYTVLDEDIGRDSTRVMLFDNDRTVAWWFNAVHFVDAGEPENRRQVADQKWDRLRFTVTQAVKANDAVSTKLTDIDTDRLINEITAALQNRVSL
jgi:hypothetical protein